MKRGAEKQISKDDRSDDEGQEEHPQAGFKKADESILATRKIRGLPKRASVAAIPPPAPEASSTNFGGFSGFGGSNSFSAFSSTTTTTPPTSLFPLSTNATSTAKSLTSLLSSTPTTLPLPTTSSTSSSSPFSTAPITPLTSGKPPASVQNGSTDDPAKLKYLTSLRGLNESLHDTLLKVISDDAFADVSVFLERYKSLRDGIQKDFDGKTTQPALFPKSTQNPPTPASAPVPAPVTKTSSMPAPPSGGFIFGGAKVSTASDTKTAANGGGFTPSLSVPSGGFVFGKPAETKQEPKPSTGSLFGTAPDHFKKPDTGPSSFSSPFGAKPAQEKPTPSLFGTEPEEKKDIPSSLFLFGSGSTASNSSGSFNFGVNPTPSVLSGVKDKTEEKPKSLFSLPGTTTPASSFTFGNNASVAPASTNASGDAPTSRFAGFAGFGQPASKPPGFGFAAPPPPTSSITSALAPARTTGSDADAGASGEAAGDDVPKKNAAESFAFNADNKHDQEGAGEEDEETRHAVKLKAYIMKDTNGAKNWVEMGYGVLRIKKHKETGSRRVLLRSSSTGQILINFAFHSAFKPAHKGKNVTFLGHDTEQNSKMYTLKLQTQDQATQLKAALDKEIQAKEESS